MHSAFQIIQFAIQDLRFTTTLRFALAIAGAGQFNSHLPVLTPHLIRSPKLTPHALTPLFQHMHIPYLPYQLFPYPHHEHDESMPTVTVIL